MGFYFFKPYWHRIAAGKRKGSFLQRYGIWYTDRTPTQPGLDGFKKGEKRKREKEGERERKRERGRERENEVGWVERWGKIWEDLEKGNEYDQNTLYKVLKESIKILLRKFQPAYSVFVP